MASFQVSPANSESWFLALGFRANLASKIVAKRCKSVLQARGHWLPAHPRTQPGTHRPGATGARCNPKDQPPKPPLLSGQHVPALEGA